MNIVLYTGLGYKFLLDFTFSEDISSDIVAELATSNEEDVTSIVSFSFFGLRDTFLRIAAAFPSLSPDDDFLFCF